MPATTAPGNAEDAEELAAAAASAAVAAGALLAGPVLKKSEWLKQWNPRFAVLTTEQLVWYRSASPSGGTGERRAISLEAGMEVKTREGGLAVATASGQVQVHFRASSDAELNVWAQQLQSLLSALLDEARAARLCVREAPDRFAAPPFAEHPHAGSRNLRERRLAKLLFTCGKAKAEAGRRHVGLGSGVPGLAHGPKEEVWLSVMVLPPPAAAWSSSECHAFSSLLAAMAHPFLLPVLHADVEMDRGRLAIFRPFLPLGSVKDAIHRATDPRLPYSLKYESLAEAGGRVCTTLEPTGAGLPRQIRSGRTAALVAQYGRQILEGLRCLRSLGVPGAHLHSGNVLLERQPGGGCVCRLSEAELALVGAKPYAELLALPRPAPGSSRYVLEREIACFGFVLFEMLTAAELTEQELSNWQRAAARNARFPGPPAAWALLQRIFLPSAEAAQGPTLMELLADPFFSVELPQHAAAAAPADLDDGCAALLGLARASCADLLFENGKAVAPPEGARARSGGKGKKKSKAGKEPGSGRRSSAAKAEARSKQKSLDSTLNDGSVDEDDDD